MSHVMIDLETMGNGHDASITQIGAVEFDHITGKFGAEFSADVRLASSVEAGLKIDPSTVTWWMAQDGEARAAWLDSQDHKKSMTLQHALHEFSKFLAPIELQGVWSHGATFDLPILSTAYRALGRPMGWNFRIARDTRTLFWLCDAFGFDPWQEAPVPGDVKHRALDDARRQARAVCRAYDYLSSRGAP